LNAPDTDPYWLVVYVDGAGTLQTEKGLEGTPRVGNTAVDPATADVREIHSPAPPTLASVGPVAVLGRVLVTADGVSNGLIDDRVFGGDYVVKSLQAQSLDVGGVVINKMLNLGTRTSETISNGEIDTSDAHIQPNGESGSSDTLDTILVDGSDPTSGDAIVLAGGTEEITISHGTGNIKLNGGSDVTLGANRFFDVLFLFCASEGTWSEIAYGSNPE
jgi:hypothetical protein